MTVRSGQQNDNELAALSAWIRNQGVEVSGDLTSELIAGGRSNLTYKLSDSSRTWVLRRPPVAGHTPSAHDVAREYRVTRALEGTAVPVPRTIAACSDIEIIGVPFTIVEFVPGAVIRTASQLSSIEPHKVHEIVNALVGALADLHQVDYKSVGLAEYGRPDRNYAARQLRRWSGQWEYVGRQSGTGAASAASEVLNILTSSVPERQSACIVHGDYRIDNALIDRNSGRVRAILDWELSTIGDPVADVALMCVYRGPALNAILGFDAAWTSSELPTVDDLVRRYVAAGGASLENWDFWLALSSYKLAVIAAGIDHRWRCGGTTGPGFDTAANAVRPLLEQALVYAKQHRRSASRRPLTP